MPFLLQMFCDLVVSTLATIPFCLRLALFTPLVSLLCLVLIAFCLCVLHSHVRSFFWLAAGFGGVVGIVGFDSLVSSAKP